jgi:hypothetical protein
LGSGYSPRAQERELFVPELLRVRDWRGDGKRHREVFLCDVRTEWLRDAASPADVAVVTATANEPGSLFNTPSPSFAANGSVVVQANTAHLEVMGVTAAGFGTGASTPSASLDPTNPLTPAELASGDAINF